jgi:hypothetical protein
MAGDEIAAAVGVAVFRLNGSLAVLQMTPTYLCGSSGIASF